ncbi:MAG: hypothetical protein QM733_14205 [Ilumatobacteraceae bacterium]
MLVAELPDLGTELLDGEIADPRRLAGAQEQARHDERGDLAAVLGRTEPLDDRHLAVLADVDDQAREDGVAVGGHGVGDDDRLGDDGALRDRQRHGVGEGQVELVEQVVDGGDVDIGVALEAVGAFDGGGRASRPERGRGRARRCGCNARPPRPLSAATSPRPARRPPCEPRHRPPQGRARLRG